jgi:hypothetical protein
MDHKCKIPVRTDDEKRIAMTEIFDLIAGTDTGAIIAGAIAVRNDTTRNLVNNTMAFFEEYGTEYYKARKLGVGWQALITAVWAIFVGCITFCCFRGRFNPKLGYVEKIKEL